MEILNSSSRDSGNTVTTGVVFDEAHQLKLDVYTSHRTRNAPTMCFSTAAAGPMAPRTNTNSSAKH